MKTGDLVKYALLLGGGYMLYNYLVQSGMWAQWFGPAAGGGLMPVGAGNLGAQLPPGTLLPAGTNQPAGGNTGQVSILLHDNSGSSVFRAGDQFTLTVTGPPNAPVMITASQNGGPFNQQPVQLGSTDANGRFVLVGNWVAANAGTWIENITVGGAPAPPG
jgi:hypothetical protein